MSYHNTTRLSGTELRDSQVKEQTQTEKVLRFFEKHPQHHLSPSDVHDFVGGLSPLTSTRRSISDLTKEGKLEKTNIQKNGKYGKLTYTWRLAFKTQLF